MIMQFGIPIAWFIVSIGMAYLLRVLDSIHSPPKFNFENDKVSLTICSGLWFIGLAIAFYLVLKYLIDKVEMLISFLTKNSVPN